MMNVCIEVARPKQETEIIRACNTKVVKPHPQNSIIELAEKGPRGIKGESGAYGYQLLNSDSYSQGSPLVLLAGVRTAVNFNITSQIDELQDPFTGHNFISDNKIDPLALDDVYSIRMNFKGETSVVNTSLLGQIDIGGTQKNIENQRVKFDKDVGISLDFSMQFTVFAKDTFEQNEGQIYITASQDSELWDFNLLFIPLSAA